jgi:hypothetical protein
MRHESGSRLKVFGMRQKQLPTMFDNASFPSATTERSFLDGPLV